MSKYSDSISMNGVEVQPGERKTILLPMPSLYNWSPLSMPVHVIRGKNPGPVLCVTSAIHGDEVNGVEIVRRLLKKSLLKKMSGTLIAVPIVNIYGFLYQDRYLMDRRDLNRSFPGSEQGSVAARLANLIIKEVISKATHAIDLHAGSLYRTNLPQIRVDLDAPGSEMLARAFNAPVILHAELRDGSLRAYATEKNIPFILYEAGEALRFDEMSIRTGVNGIINIMRKLDMVSLDRPGKKNFKSTISRASYWIRASHGGVVHPMKQLGRQVKKGEVLATIGNPTTTEEHKLLSPISGIIIGKSNLPITHEGAALFHISTFEKIDLVADQIQDMQESYSDL
jgi:predicted deacylase